MMNDTFTLTVLKFFAYSNKFLTFFHAKDLKFKCYITPNTTNLEVSHKSVYDEIAS